MKKRVGKLTALLLCLCICFPLGIIASPQAFADTEIKRVTVNAEPVPVAGVSVLDTPATVTSNNCNIISYNWYDSYGNVISGRFNEDVCRIVITLEAPFGFVFSAGARVYLNNDPVDYEIGEYNSTLTLYRDYMPNIWMPSINKHPGDETVEEGGLASFVASANYATNMHWTLLSPEEDTYADAEDLSSVFPGVTINDAYSEKLNINHVPRELDGWKVYCTFSNSEAAIESDIALLTVNYEGKGEEPPEEEEPEPDESAELVAPTAPPTPEPTETPVIEEHMHSFSDIWQSDVDTHWKECECGERSEKGLHKMETVMSVPATKKGKGFQKLECSVCGYTVTRELPYASRSASAVILSFVFEHYLLVGIGLLLIIIAVTAAVSIGNARARKRRKRKRMRY